MRLFGHRTRVNRRCKANWSARFTLCYEVIRIPIRTIQRNPRKKCPKSISYDDSAAMCVRRPRQRVERLQWWISKTVFANDGCMITINDVTTFCAQWTGTVFTADAVWRLAIRRHIYKVHPSRTVRDHRKTCAWLVLKWLKTNWSIWIHRDVLLNIESKGDIIT